MSLGHGASVSRNGLKIYYDPANIKSYPGSGTDLFDVSGNNIESRLENGVSLDSSNSGCFYFDGVNDRIISKNVLSISSTDVSAMVWVKVDGHGNFHNFIRNNWVNNGWIIYSSTTSWVGGVASSNTQYNSGIEHNNSTDWTNLCFTYDGSIVTFYLNGVSVNTRSTPSPITLDTGYYITFGDGARPSPYRISTTLVYNRSISSEEVKQNFEATRGRFGI